MYGLAVYEVSAEHQAVFDGIVDGLKLLAVVVVATATLKMAEKFCQGIAAICVCMLTAALLLLLPGVWPQIGVLLAAALFGLLRGWRTAAGEASDSGRFRPVPMVLFLLLLFGLPALLLVLPQLELFSTFYQAGALVFGGGHVVLPLLQHLLGDAMSADDFLLGYAAAQGVPGPMFSLAAYLGAELSPQAQLAGAVIAVAGVFLPGYLLLISLHGAWEALAARPRVAGAVWGINAAVVGLLLAALYQPVFVSAVHVPVDMALVLLGFLALYFLKTPIVFLVLGFALIGCLRTFL